MRRGERSTFASSRPQWGMAMVWVLAVVAVTGIGLAAVGPVWGQAAQRDRERDLLRIGTEYAKAITAYYLASPLTKREYPKNLESLVEDTRGGFVRRHLRRLYPDPVAPDGAWGLVRDADGSIHGVYSQSDVAPLQQTAVSVGDHDLPSAKAYKDWKFLAKVTR